ncbi:MAG TPA: AraC family transcriptional regulator, partial [Bacillota bacterium]|nr:AraC family transcriptional regulator [Bacillota bacterium]
ARRAANLMESVHQQFTEQIGGWPCRGRSYLLELLFLIGRAFESRQQTEEIILPDNEGMDQVILYLHNHYQEQLKLSDLTQMFHINRTTLIERFTKATGGTIKEYLINLRLRLASLMLRDTLLPVTEIMERTGFNDITHFGRMFKKYTGLTPSDYRRQLCWMLEFYPDYQD